MKIVKKTWIAILALATAVVAACTAAKHNSEGTGVSKSADNDGLGSVDKENIDEKNNDAVPNDSIKAHLAEMQERLENLRIAIREREMSCVYGSPEVMQSYSANTRKMRYEADSLQKEIMKELETEKSGMVKQLEEIDEIIKGRSGAKVYGPPETMKRYNEKTREFYVKRDSLQNEIGKIDAEIHNVQNKH